jgi:hypothetical protein
MERGHQQRMAPRRRSLEFIEPGAPRCPARRPPRAGDRRDRCLGPPARRSKSRHSWSPPSSSIVRSTVEFVDERANALHPAIRASFRHAAGHVCRCRRSATTSTSVLLTSTLMLDRRERRSIADALHRLAPGWLVEESAVVRLLRDVTRRSREPDIRQSACHEGRAQVPAGPRVRGRATQVLSVSCVNRRHGRRVVTNVEQWE